MWSAGSAGGDDSVRQASASNTRDDMREGSVAAREVQGPERRRILLILDMNGLLLDTRHRFCDASELPAFRAPDARTANCLVYKRPHCSEFIQFCLDSFDVGIWSSAARHNLMALVDLVFPNDKQRLAFIWDQSKCTNTGLKHPQNKHKPLFLKELSHLWSAAEGQGQAHGPCTCAGMGASKTQKKRKAELSGTGLGSPSEEDKPGAKRGGEAARGAFLLDAPAAYTGAVTGQGAAPVAAQGTDAPTSNGAGADTGHCAGRDTGAEILCENALGTARCQAEGGEEGQGTGTAQTALPERDVAERSGLGPSQAPRESPCCCTASMGLEESAAARWRRGMYGPTNTLLVDDSPYKASKNPPYTGVFPAPYDASNQESTTDAMLGKGGAIRSFLEGLLGAEDMQEYVRRSGFGQAPVVLGPQGQMLRVSAPAECPASPTQAAAALTLQEGGAVGAEAPQRLPREEKAEPSTASAGGHACRPVGAAPAVAASRGAPWLGTEPAGRLGGSAPLRSPWTAAERPLQAMPVTPEATSSIQHEPAWVPAWVARASAAPHGRDPAGVPGDDGALFRQGTAQSGRPSTWRDSTSTLNKPVPPGQAGPGPGRSGWPPRQGPLEPPQGAGSPSSAVLAHEGHRASAFEATPQVGSGTRTRVSGWDQLPQPQHSAFLRPGAGLPGASPLGAPRGLHSTLRTWSHTQPPRMQPNPSPELGRVPGPSSHPGAVPWHPSRGQPQRPPSQSQGQFQIPWPQGQIHEPPPGSWPPAPQGPGQGPWSTPRPQGPAYARPAPFLAPGKWGRGERSPSIPAPGGVVGSGQYRPSGGAPGWVSSELQFHKFNTVSAKSHEQRHGREAWDA